MGEKDYKITVLENNNYVTWKWHITTILKAKDLYDQLNYVGEPTQKNQKALALFGSTLSQENQLRVSSCNKEAWETIEKCYENKTSYEPQALFQKLNTYKISRASEVSKGLSEITGIVTQLKNLGEQVSDNNLMGAILGALPSTFEVFKTVWRNGSTADRTVDNLVTRLMSDASEIAAKEESEGETKALVLKHFKRFNKKQPRSNDISPAKKEGNCKYCKEAGHWIRECPALEGRNWLQKKKKQ